MAALVSSSCLCFCRYESSMGVEGEAERCTLPRCVARRRNSQLTTHNSFTQNSFFKYQYKLNVVLHRF